MKIMFISDIHGISTNLDYIKNKYNELNIDKLIVLGDLYYIGPRNDMIEGYNIKKVMEFLDSFKNILCMRGNCDSEVDLEVSNFEIKEDMEMITVDDINIYLTHGHIYNERLNGIFRDKKGVLVFGHYHYPFTLKTPNMTYINTGSVSLPRNGSKPSYLIYENKKFTLYDIEDNVIDMVEM